MLSVQPKFTTKEQTAFTSNREDYSYESIEERRAERRYNKTRKDLIKQKREFEELNDNPEFKVPKLAKKALQGGAIITTGLLGGMATGWGAKQSIKAFSKLWKTAPMQAIKEQVQATYKFTRETAKLISKKFKSSDMYIKPKLKIEKFETTKIGSPIVKFFRASKNICANTCKTIKDFFQYLGRKIKSVSSETYSKATVNIVGGAGGIAAGGNALKNQQEKNQEGEQ